jgi:hypothetical protein
MLSTNNGKLVNQFEDYKIGKVIVYNRFNYFTNENENRNGKIRGIKVHEKLVEIFVRDVEDDTRNCVMIKK